MCAIDHRPCRHDRAGYPRCNRPAGHQTGVDRHKPCALHAGRFAGRLHSCQGDGERKGRRRGRRSSAPLRRTAFQPSPAEGARTMRDTLARTTEENRTSARREDLQSVTPHLVCAGAAEAMDFYKRAFGAVELMRLPGRDGRLVHGAVAIGGGRVMLVDEMPECGALSPRSLKGTPVTVHLYVDDVDAFVDRAVMAGASLRMPVTDM